MQYLLTQEEMDRLVPKVDLVKATDAIGAMRRMIVPVGKCVHDQLGPAYCDDCPLSSTGGLNDKRKPTYEMSKQMCNLHRRYSK
jgi:hypothetical protein